MPKTIALVSGILENYANRGTFKGFSRGPVRAGVASFKILWHRDQFFDLILDTHKKTLRFRVVLPEVPAGSPIYREFKQFVESRHSENLPDHRRIDPKKATVRPSNRSGNVALTLTVKKSDYEYATRKLIHLVHEIFLVFLQEGHYDYMVRVFDLDPDHL
jgi:hypothetical protein